MPTPLNRVVRGRLAAVAVTLTALELAKLFAELEHIHRWNAGARERAAADPLYREATGLPPAWKNRPPKPQDHLRPPGGAG